MQFKKMVAIEPVHLPQKFEEALRRYTGELVLCSDIPADNDEIIRRIGDADAVLVSYTSRIEKPVLESCPNLRYIGMCCSLYAPESANVDILTAEKLGITVTGVRDYGDEGVAEYAVYALVQLLHGFGGAAQWRPTPTELTGLNVGILGMGTTGQIVAKALRYFGADISYSARTRRPQVEQAYGYSYLPMEQLLEKAEILCTCLTKNVVLLGEKELERVGEGKIILNISLSPSFEIPAMERWLARPGNYLLGDSDGAVDPAGNLQKLPNVLCGGKSAGMTSQATVRLGQKVIDNIEAFLMG